VKRVVEAHGGEIAVANRDRGGASFTMRLQLARSSFSPGEDAA
jgi:signal transduction histidine kinase